MDYFCLTDPGKVRDHNEDSVAIVMNESLEYLLAVADGMGGHRAGEIASNITINHLTKRFKDKVTVGTKEEAIEFLKQAVSEANEKIYEYTEENPESKGMGTTIVVALFTNDYLLFGNIGDSSGFVFKNNKIHKVTTDHTLVNLLVKSGELTEEEARKHPRKNVLMRALGATTTVEMDIVMVETDVDGILLCSDGLTNMLEFEQIEKVLNEKLDAQDMVRKLINKSNNRGGNDNISIACILMNGGKKNDN